MVINKYINRLKTSAKRGDENIIKLRLSDDDDDEEYDFETYDTPCGY